MNPEFYLPNNSNEIYDKYGLTDIHRAAAMGNLHLVASLYLYGVDIDKYDLNGLTPIMYSCFHQKCMHCFQFLLSAGANMKLKTLKTGNSILDLLVLNGNYNILRYILMETDFLGMPNIKTTLRKETIRDLFVNSVLLRRVVNPNSILSKIGNCRIYRKIYGILFPGLSLIFILFVNSWEIGFLLKVLVSISISIFFGLTLKFSLDGHSISHVIFGAGITSEITFLILIFKYLHDINNPSTFMCMSLLLTFISIISRLLINVVMIRPLKLTDFVLGELELSLKNCANERELLEIFCIICKTSKPKTSIHCYQCKSCINNRFYHSNRLQCCINEINIVFYVVNIIPIFFLSAFATFITGIWLFHSIEYFIEAVSKRAFSSIYKAIWDVGFKILLFMVQLLCSGVYLIELSWLIMIICHRELIVSDEWINE